MGSEWNVRCKDCNDEFGYSDYSLIVGSERGQSRPERCTACRRKHNGQTATMAVPYLDLKPRKSADTSRLRSGALGSLAHAARLHEQRTVAATFDLAKFGMTDDDFYKLVKVLRKYQVAVLVGPTGSGKSTFLPFRLMCPPSDVSQDEFTRHGQILVTQPRIQATRNIPAWVAKELLGGSLGSGYDIGFRYSEHPFSDWRNRLVYVTDGTLINWIITGQIANFSVIMIDEAHERSVNIDLILGLLKRVLPRYPHLRVIVASATINQDLFLSFFDAAEDQAVICEGVSRNSVDGGSVDVAQAARGAPRERVKVEHRGEGTSSDEAPLPYEGPIARLAQEVPSAMATKMMRILKDEPPGDILGFLHGKRAIEQTVAILKASIEGEPTLAGKVDVYPLYTELSQPRQNQALLPKVDSDRRRVVITTNVAETSLTVEDIAYVVDSGLINLEQWDLRAETKQVPVLLHSQAGCRQRHGRTGRTRDGVAYCLYTREQWDNLFPKHTVPQIQRSSLEKLVLSAKAAGIEDLRTFDWIEDPPHEELDRAIQRLTERGALDDGGDLTDYGLELQGFAEEPEIANLMIAADRYACVTEMATIVAMMKVGLRELLVWSNAWDAQTQLNVTRIHRALQGGCQDDVEFALKIYAAWSESTWSESFASDWARRATLRRRLLRNLAPPDAEMMKAFTNQSVNGDALESVREFETQARQVADWESLNALVNQFGLGEAAAAWLKNAKTLIDDAAREAWAITFLVNHSLLKDKVEPQRETLIRALSGHKKEEERRDINFDMLDRIRILFSACLTQQTYELVSGKGDDAVIRPVASPINQLDVDTTPPRPIKINRDSVCLREPPSQFVAAKRQIIAMRLTPESPVTDVMHLSFVCRVEERWRSQIAAASQSDQRRSFLGLGRLISRETRDRSTGDLYQTRSYARLFLDQFLPMGSAYACTVSAVNDRSRPTLDIGARLYESPQAVDNVESTFDELSWDEEADASDGDALADNVLRPGDQLIANPEEDVDPPWWSFAIDDPTGEEPWSRARWTCPECRASLAVGSRECPECATELFANASELGGDGSMFGEVRGVLSPQVVQALTSQICVPCQRVMPEGSSECSGCGAPLRLYTATAHGVGEQLAGEVVGYDFSDPGHPTVLLKPVSDEDALEVFQSLYRQGDQAPVSVTGYAERPGDWKISLIVSEPFSGVESVIGPSELNEAGRGLPAKEIPVGSVLWPVIEHVDGSRGRVVFSLLPLLEKHLTSLPVPPMDSDRVAVRGKIFEIDNRDRYRIYALLSASVPAEGLVHCFEIDTQNLSRPVDMYERGVELDLELVYQRSRYRPLDELPAEVDHALQGGQFSQLRWDNGRLQFFGRLSYALRRDLLGISDDSSYQAAIRALHRFCQPRAQITDVAGWESLSTKYPPGSEVLVKVLRNNQAGVTVEVEEGVESFIRDSALSAKVERDGDTELKLRVGRISIEDRTIYWRPVNDPLSEIAVGDITRGPVQDVKEFGLFVEVAPGVNGLVHRNEMWGRVDDAGRVAGVGKEVLVKVIAVDLDKRTVSLSMKLPENDPLVALQVGGLVTGPVVSWIDSGAFIEIAPGVNGYVWVGELTNGFTKHPSDVVAIGQIVQARILSIDTESRKTSLSIKQAPNH